MKYVLIASSMLLVLAGGCVLTPKGTKQEMSRLDEAGKPFEPSIEKRELPQLSDTPSWRDVLHRAFLANGDLEASYFEWKAAMQRIDMAGTWPNSNVQVGFSYMFSGEKMKSWDRTTVSAGFDPSVNLMLPNKVAKAAQQALENARAAGFKFEATKFDVQRRVLTTYLDLALTDEKIRIQQDNVSLLKLLSDSAENRVQAGGPQQDLLKAQIAHHLAENELANLQAEAKTMQAMLNAMLARDPQAPIQIKSMPEARPVPADDAQLIAAGVDRNPELAGLAAQVRGRQDALELARLAYLPDINPSGGFTGTVSQFAGAMFMLPTTIPMIRGQIEESRAMLRSAQAMAAQSRRDRAASFIADLYIMRNAQRQAEFFEQRIIPAAQQTLDSSRQAYAAGTVGFVELVDAQRTLLDVRLMVAEARIEREKRLADMEALAGVDVETVSPSPGTPGEGRGEGSSPTSRPSAIATEPSPTPLPDYREREGVRQ
jgi:cobalt-zinc-cadmium efflux system outer membrane protein